MEISPGCLVHFTKYSSKTITKTVQIRCSNNCLRELIFIHSTEILEVSRETYLQLDAEHILLTLLKNYMSSQELHVQRYLRKDLVFR